MPIQLTPRQLDIVELVREHAPVTGDQIAEMIGLSRPTLRADLSLLTMLGLISAKPKVGYFPAETPSSQGEFEQRLQQIYVKDIYSTPVTISEHATAYDAVVQLLCENTGTLMVTGESGELKGVVSRKDVLKLTMGHADLSTIPVGLAMTRRAHMAALTPEETVLDAADKLVKHQVNCLPVVSGEGDSMMVGRVTKTDILRVLIGLTGKGDSPAPN
ncbi:CBS domain-containing protein [Paenibacillus sp. PSB04]|uniref:CBS domain-containing protein n=1 Tax=Paenibacillus sp. PSB04 TaxID=2866810 RepID=UPI0021F230BA|nr:CBS domain-containing protein [Paenibacillus sp. PSB04]UYO07949.1 CBS domain-containing protein [Paenibacillus sp. PSB04]